MDTFYTVTHLDIPNVEVDTWAHLYHNPTDAATAIRAYIADEFAEYDLTITPQPTGHVFQIHDPDFHTLTAIFHITETYLH